MAKRRRVDPNETLESFTVEMLGDLKIAMRQIADLDRENAKRSAKIRTVLTTLKTNVRSLKNRERPKGSRREKR